MFIVDISSVHFLCYPTDQFHADIDVKTRKKSVPGNQLAIFFGNSFRV